MIQVNTKLNIIDNSGGKISKIIRLLGGNKKTRANLGNLAVISVKKVKDNNSKIKKGEVHKFRILRLKEPVHRKDGSFMNFDLSGGVVLKDPKTPLASRIAGPLNRELRRKLGKITSLSKKLI